MIKLFVCCQQLKSQEDFDRVAIKMIAKEVSTEPAVRQNAGGL